MEVENYMKRHVISIHRHETLISAARLILEYHIGTLPVIDEQGKLIGILRLRDILNIIMPDFVDLLDNWDFIGNFGALEWRLPAKKDCEIPVEKVMEPPVSVLNNQSLLYAAAIIRQSKITDLPVVDADKKLIGIASHVDIGTALLKKIIQSLE